MQATQPGPLVQTGKGSDGMSPNLGYRTRTDVQRGFENLAKVNYEEANLPEGGGYVDVISCAVRASESLSRNSHKGRL